MKILGVIPARYQSVRLPGKPLVNIAGQPMIQRVWARARQAACLTDLVVATDDARIAEVIRQAGGGAVMTSPDHPSGTDRLLEVARLRPDYDAYINIQGDEPLIDPAQIDQVGSLLQSEGAYVATLVKRLDLATELHNPNTVKVARDAAGRALYFSRSPIPFLRNQAQLDQWHAEHGYFKHIGMYGYRAEALPLIAEMPRGHLETTESLEQLRWLEHGLQIVVGETEIETQGVDVPADVERVEQLLEEIGEA